MSEKSSTSSANTITRERVDDLSSRQNEPGWLKQERISAWELYLQMPMPTQRDEDWRRTEIDSLSLTGLKTLEFGREKTDSLELPPWFKSALEHIENPAAIMALTSSHLWFKPLADHLVAKGVIFCELFEALVKYPDVVRRCLASDFPGDVAERLDSKFGLMNKAMFNGGLFLYVPAGVEIERPFISLTSFDHTSPSASIPRILVVAEKESKAQLVHIFASRNDQAVQGKATVMSLANTLVEIHVADSAKFDYVEVQNFDSRVFSVNETHNVIAKDAQFYSLTVAMGGAQLKSDIKTVLQDRGANSDVQGLVLGDGSERFSFNTIQEHNSPDTTSNINFRVALKDESASIYQGIIRVAKVAQRTDAYQSNKNLLIGSGARAESIPKLEILADDVKCSHGATVGPVDREQIFYLMSRGLNAQEAEELVVIGFFRKVLEDCTIDGVSEWIGDLVASKIQTQDGSGSSKS
jgi:Fe-S cluster assembly protein SufD